MNEAGRDLPAVSTYATWAEDRRKNKAEKQRQGIKCLKSLC